MLGEEIEGEWVGFEIRYWLRRFDVAGARRPGLTGRLLPRRSLPAFGSHRQSSSRVFPSALTGAGCPGYTKPRAPTRYAPSREQGLR